MRRDLHRWFLVGATCAAMVLVLLALILQSVEVTVNTLVCVYCALSAVVLYARHRRRNWWRLCGTYRDEMIPSRELRCRPLAETQHPRDFTVVTK